MKKYLIALQSQMRTAAVFVVFTNLNFKLSALRAKLINWGRCLYTFCFDCSCYELRLKFDWQYFLWAYMFSYVDVDILYLKSSP